MVTKPRLLKYLNRYITSWGFITRNIFDFLCIFNRNWQKRKCFCIRYLLLTSTISRCLLNFLMTLISVSLVKTSLFESNSKLFNFSIVSAKRLLKFLAILSLFTNQVSFPTILFVSVVISYFSKRITLESPWRCLLEKWGLRLSQKGF